MKHHAIGRIHAHDCRCKRCRPAQAQFWAGMRDFKRGGEIGFVIGCILTVINFWPAIVAFAGRLLAD